MSETIDPTGAPSEATPRLPIPWTVVTGAWPEGAGWAVLFGLLSPAALALSRFWGRDPVAQLARYAAAAAAAVALGLALLLILRVLAARRLYRDGALVDGRVLSHGRLVEVDTDKQVGLLVDVEVTGPDGARRVATFGDLDMAVRSTAKVLVHGDHAGLYMATRRVGRRRAATLRPYFRMARLRAAPPAPPAPVFGVAVTSVAAVMDPRLVEHYPAAARLHVDTAAVALDPSARLLLPFVATAGDVRAALEAAERSFSARTYAPEDVVGCSVAQYVAMRRVDERLLRDLGAPGEVRLVGTPVVAMLGAVPMMEVWFRQALERSLFREEALRDGLRVGVELAWLHRRA